MLSEKDRTRQEAFAAAVKLLESLGAEWSAKHPRAPGIDLLVLTLDEGRIRIAPRENRFREQRELFGAIADRFSNRLDGVRDKLLAIIPWTCLPFQMSAVLTGYISGTCKAGQVVANLAGLSADRYGDFPGNLIQRLDREDMVAKVLGLQPGGSVSDWACIQDTQDTSFKPTLAHIIHARSHQEAALRLAAFVLSREAFTALIEGRESDISDPEMRDFTRFRICPIPAEDPMETLLLDVLKRVPADSKASPGI